MKIIKLQSAMEYLMTYGWAILIIAVVLAALFQLGVFNSSSFSPRAPPGSCQVFRPGGPNTVTNINLIGVCTGQLPQYVAKFGSTASQILTPSETIGSSSFSISFYFYVTAFPTGNYYWLITNSYYGGNSNAAKWTMFLDMRGYPTYGPIGLRLNDGTQLNDYVTYTQTSCNPIITAGAWHFVGVSINTASKAYSFTVDNTPCGSGSYGALGSFLSPNSIYIGAAGVGGNNYQGSLANFQIYNTSLSANDMQALYVEGMGGAPIKLQNIAGWWPLNGNSNDYSGNNNNGVPTAVTFTSQYGK